MTGADNSCMVCGATRHPLHTCKKFRLLSSEQHMEVVRQHKLCFNCLKPGHFNRHCMSDQKCQKCRGPHHTLLHPQFDCGAEAKADDRVGRGRMQSLPAEVTDSSMHHNSHLSHPDPGGQRSTLLMTCQIAVVAADGSMVKARALIDCASSTSLVTECLVERMQLPPRHQSSRWHWR